MTTTDIDTRIAELESQLDHAKFMERNSSWASGPAHRANIARIEKQISDLEREKKGGAA